jgi:hypothetical protein
MEATLRSTLLATVPEAALSGRGADDPLIGGRFALTDGFFRLIISAGFGDLSDIQSAVLRDGGLRSDRVCFRECGRGGPGREIGLAATFGCPAAGGGPNQTALFGSDWRASLRALGALRFAGDSPPARTGHAGVCG